MNNSLKKQSLEQGAFILLFASLIVKIIGALFKIPLSSNAVLGDLGFGYFSVAHDFIAPFHTLAISGFPVAIAKIITDYSANNEFCNANRIFKLSRRILFIISVIFVVISLGFLIFKAFNNNDFNGSFYSYMFVIPSAVFCIIASSYRGGFEGVKQMIPVAISNVIEAVCKLILGLSFAVITIKITGNYAFSAAAAILGIFFGSFFSFLYLHLCFKFTKPLNCVDSCAVTDKHSEKDLVKKIIIISVPVIVSSLSGSIIAFIDSITVRAQMVELYNQNSNEILKYFSDLISEIKNSANGNLNADLFSTTLYGIRSKGFTMFNLVPMLTISIGVGATPVIAENFIKNNKTELKANIISVFKLSSVIALPAGLGYFFLGNRIISLLYGNGASTALCGKVLSIYGIAAIFAAIALPLGNVLLAIDKRKSVLVNIFIGILLKIFLNLILCSFVQINILGSVISTLVCYGYIFISYIITLFSKIDVLNMLSGTFFKLFSAALICTVTAFLITLMGDSKPMTLIAVLVAIMVYVFFLNVFNVFSDDEILNLPFGKKIIYVKNALKRVKKC